MALRWIDSPTERSSAATDVLLALLCAFFALAIGFSPAREPLRRTLWAILFAGVGGAALAGAVYHGLVLTPRTRRRLWRAVTLGLAVAAAAFAAILGAEIGGTLSAAVGAGLFAAALLGSLAAAAPPWGFAAQSLLQGALLAVGTAVWGGLIPGRANPGLAAGCAASLAAGLVQATRRARLRLFWEFDHNGLFHLLQAAGLALFAAGVRWP
ncbi:MAG: hypothetical protein WHT06_02965 [Desulfobacterales bacterium]